MTAFLQIHDNWDTAKGFWIGMIFTLVWVFLMFLRYRR